MATLKVIGLVGQAGSGKSEVAQHLITNHNFMLVKFAGILKDMCRMLGLTEREIEGDLKEVPCPLLLGQTPRFAMQTLGTEWGRDTIHQGLWVHAWQRRVNEYLKQDYRVVSDDCRFGNEANAVERFQPSQLWRIKRKDLVMGNHELWKSHPTENESDNIYVDKTIKNYGTIGELKTAVDGLLNGRT